MIDSTTLISYGVIAASLSAHLYTVITQKEKWEQRDIYSLYKWNTTMLISVSIAALLGVIELILTRNPLLPSIVFAAALPLSHSILTDLKSSKVAKEPLWNSAILAVIALAVLYTFTTAAGTHNLIQLGFSAVALWIVPFILAFITKGGLGMGDVRVLMVTVLWFGWWVSPTVLLGMLVLATVMQISYTLLFRRKSNTINGLPAHEGDKRRYYKFTLALATAMMIAPIIQIIMNGKSL